MLVYPLLQFAVFYIYINMSSFLLAFQTDVGSPLFDNGFQNFVDVIRDIKMDKTLSFSIKNSFIAYGISLAVGTPLGLIFSFFIYKKVWGYRFFRIILFMPSIVSSIVLVLIFKYFANKVVSPTFFADIKPLLDNRDTAFWTVIFYNIFIGFGPSTLMYSSTMGSINESVVESAQLDGITFMKEFWHICLPMIYPTIVTFLVAGVAGIFTNQFALFDFFGKYPKYPEVYTLGFFMYRGTVLSETGDKFPYLSAMGMLMTLVAAPVTLILKRLLEKFGPSTT